MLAALGGDVLGFARNDVARLSKPRLALVQPTSGDMHVTKGGMSLRTIHGLHDMARTICMCTGIKCPQASSLITGKYHLHHDLANI